MSKRIVSGTGTALGSATVVAIGKVRTNLSLTHVFSAARFSRAVASLEAQHAGASFGEFFEEILANASACVLLTVAGLEAFANELFVDHRTHLPDVAAAVVDHVWAEVERTQILTKIDLALVLQGRPALDRSRTPVQDVLALVDLRNALTHFKPEWQDEAVKHRRLSAVLSTKISPTPFLPDSELLFPRRWASGDCTAWAVRSAASVMRDVEISLAGRSRIDKFESRLRG